MENEMLKRNNMVLESTIDLTLTELKANKTRLEISTHDLQDARFELRQREREIGTIGEEMRQKIEAAAELPKNHNENMTKYKDRIEYIENELRERNSEILTLTKQSYELKEEFQKKLQVEKNKSLADIQSDLEIKLRFESQKKK